MTVVQVTETDTTFEYYELVVVVLSSMLNK